MTEDQFVSALFVPLPNTRIKSKRVSGRTLRVTFAAVGGAGRSAFACKLDRGRYRTCLSPATFAGLAAGRHTLSILATDSNSRREQSPAVLKFAAG
jgi:hypothetical protein